MQSTDQSPSAVRWAYLLFVVLPLAVATGIYLFFRASPPPLLQALIAWHPISVIRLGTHFDWLVYNAPDALWSFGFTSFLLIACRRDSPMVRSLYLTLGFVLMIGLEVGQGRWFAGTYDPLDVVATAAGAGLAWLFLKRLVK
jgi:hypothetical protein